MKKAIFHIYIVLLCLPIVTFCLLNPVFAQEQLKLEVIYPKDNAEINAYSTFFVGNTHPNADLSINNENVKVYPNGAFVHVINLNSGVNDINLRSVYKDQIKNLMYKIQTPKYETTIPNSPLLIDTNSIQPNQSIIYKEGDLLQVSFKGSTGNRAYFSIGNKRKNIPMTEQPARYTRKLPIYGSTVKSSITPVKGIYNGTYRITAQDEFNNEPLIVKLISKNNKINHKTSITLSAIPANSPPIIAKVANDYAVVRTFPGKSRLTPLPKGTLINLTGRLGDTFRFEMGESMNGWIAVNDVKIMPTGTPVSESSIDIIDIDSDEEKVYIKLPLSQKLPVVIEQPAENILQLKVFGAKANIDLFAYENKDKFLKELKWYQETNNIVKFDIKADAKQLWGYKYYYEDDTLVLELKKPPMINPDKPFENITICLDPGHGGKEDGAVGPTGITEKEINLAIALKLQKILNKKGANVVMTRTTDQFVALDKRVKISKDNDADILLSIHNNSLPDGRNPYKHHGTSTYYYHSQALPLTKTIHSALLEDLNFKDFGVFWSSFVLTRPHEALSVLLEIGFMINPDEYSLITQSKFQDKIADSIARGLEYFLFTNIQDD